MMKAHGLSYDEIGERNGWSYTKVNRAITEGRRRFMRVYEGIESGEECDRFAPIVEALAGGSATAAQVLEIRPHLRHCTACRAAVRDLHLSRLAARRCSCRSSPWPSRAAYRLRASRSACTSSPSRPRCRSSGSPTTWGICRSSSLRQPTSRSAAVGSRACDRASRSSSIERAPPTSQPGSRSRRPAAAGGSRRWPRYSDCASAGRASEPSAPCRDWSRTPRIDLAGSMLSSTLRAITELQTNATALRRRAIATPHTRPLPRAPQVRSDSLGRHRLQSRRPVRLDARHSGGNKRQDAARAVKREFGSEDPNPGNEAATPVAAHAASSAARASPRVQPAAQEFNPAEQEFTP